MYCLNCGANVPGDSKFCQGCGSRQDTWSAPFPYLPKKSKMIFLGCIGVYILCVLLVICSIVFKPTINMDKYLVVYTEGYDGYGRPVMEIDMERFAKNYGKRLVDRRTEQDPYDAAMQFVNSCIYLNSDKSERLSNGDTFTVYMSYNDQYTLETYGYKLKSSEQTFTAEGLAKPTAFDPFEGLSIEFEGTAPYGQATIVGEPAYTDIYNFYYFLDQYYDLDNGMTVTLAFDESDREAIENYFVEAYGLYPSSLTKEFTVTGLDWYVNAPEEISTEVVDAISANAQEVFSAQLDSSDEGQVLQAFNYCGAYLLTSKDPNWPNNKVYFVYQAQIQHDYPVLAAEEAAAEEGAEDTANAEEEAEATFSQLTNIYWYIEYEDLLTNDSGEVLFNMDYYNTPSNRIYIDSGISSGFWSTKQWQYRGFETLDQLFTNTIEYYLDEYELVSNVVDPAAG